MTKIEFENIAEQIITNGILKAIDKFNCPLIVSGVPENWHNDFHTHGFEEYAIFQDYWIDSLVSPGNQYNDYDVLHNGDCFTASEISIACRGLSRGFEGESPEWFFEWLDGEDKLQNSAVLVYKMDSKIVGISCTATYAHDSEKGTVLWVRMMAVHPNFQGYGIGTKLLLQTLQYGVEHGAKRAFLHADTENASAIKIYLKAGFHPRIDEKQINMILKENK